MANSGGGGGGGFKPNTKLVFLLNVRAIIIIIISNK